MRSSSFSGHVLASKFRVRPLDLLRVKLFGYLDSASANRVLELRLGSKVVYQEGFVRSNPGSLTSTRLTSFFQIEAVLRSQIDIMPGIGKSSCVFGQHSC